MAREETLDAAELLRETRDLVSLLLSALLSAEVEQHAKTISATRRTDSKGASDWGNPTRPSLGYGFNGFAIKT